MPDYLLLCICVPVLLSLSQGIVVVISPGFLIWFFFSCTCISPPSQCAFLLTWHGSCVPVKLNTCFSGASPALRVIVSFCVCVRARHWVCAHSAKANTKAGGCVGNADCGAAPPQLTQTWNAHGNVSPSSPNHFLISSNLLAQWDIMCTMSDRDDFKSAPSLFFPSFSPPFHHNNTGGFYSLVHLAAVFFFPLKLDYREILNGIAPVFRQP